MNPINVPGEAIGQARTNLFPADAPVAGVRRLIGVGLGVNINSANTDVIVPISWLLPTQNYLVTAIYINNAQINNGGTITNSATTATLGVFTASAGGGTAVVANAAISSLSALTGAGGSLALTVAAAGLGFMFTQTNNPNLFVRTGTAQGASTSATVDVYVEGIPLP